MHYNVSDYNDTLGMWNINIEYWNKNIALLKTNIEKENGTYNNERTTLHGQIACIIMSLENFHIDLRMGFNHLIQKCSNSVP